MATAINIGIRVAGGGIQHQGIRRSTREITPEAGHALQILGHAIEYLTDEYMNQSKTISASDPQVAAIHLLMSLNRQIYYECPLAPTFGHRLRGFFRRITGRGR